MTVILLRLDDFKSTLNNRPKQCPYCGREVLEGWGTGTKTIQDAQPEVGEYHRYHCNTCLRTFRYYAEGVDRSRLTQRIRKIVGLAWVLGLSSREVVDIFGESGVELNYVSVWREGNDLAKQLEGYFSAQHLGRYSIDKQFLKIKTRGMGTAIVVKLSGGKTVVLGRTDEIDYRKILAWLEPIAKVLDIQVSVMRTDVLFAQDLTSLNSTKSL